jgi:hypothetical protein
MGIMEYVLALMIFIMFAVVFSMDISAWYLT